MTNDDNIKTFLSNAKHAIWNHQQTIIGGGKFSPAEITSVVESLTKVESMALALQEISALLAKHPDFQRGDSTVHYCAHKAASAISNLEENSREELVKMRM